MLPKDEILMRTLRVLHGLSHLPADTVVLAAKTPDGEQTLGVTYGDLRSVTQQLAEANERLGRIAAWHVLEFGDHGTVGDSCRECLELYPCDTAKMADGTYAWDEDV